MDNKKRRTLAAVLAAAMVAATASVPAFATDNGNVPQTSVLGGGQVIVPSVKSAEETTQDSQQEATNLIVVGQGQEYQTVSAALESLKDETSKVATIKLMSVIEEDITIPSGCDITLDLNGFAIKNTNNCGLATIVNHGALTIVDNSTEKTGTVDNTLHGKAAIQNEPGGTCTLSGGRYTRSQENGSSASESGGNSYYNIVNHGDMTINDGVTVKQEGQFSSMIDNGWYDGTQNTEGEPSTMTINGGTFNGGLNTIKNDDYGELTINGGNFSNIGQAALLNWNVAEINGGSFTVNENAQTVILNGHINETMDRGQLTINAGEFGTNGTQTPVLQVMTGSGSKGLGNVIISGGTLNGDLDLTNASEGDSVTIGPNATINGDTKVDQDTPKDLLKTPDGESFSALVTTEDGLKNALASATEGKTIKLGANIECQNKIEITTSNITIDGQGLYRLIYNSNSSSQESPENGAFITVKNPDDGTTTKDVTLKNLTVEASGIKHGIEYYCTEGGSIEGVTVNGGAWTSIQANGAQNLTIDGCTTDPQGDSAYANIEFAMGANVETIPSIDIENMDSGDWDSNYPLIYMDNGTIYGNEAKDIKGIVGVEESLDESSTLSEVMNWLKTQNKISGVDLKISGDANAQTGIIYAVPHVEDTKPSTPSTGGSSSTQKPLEGISLGMTSAQVGPGDTLQMNVTYTPSDTTASKRVTWTSSDEDVVTVDRNGKVTATGKSGKATITATVGGKTATCTITINPFKVDVEDLNGAVTSCKADGFTVIKVPQSMSYNFDISSGVTLDSFDYTVGNDKVGGTNTIARWNGTSGKYQIYAAGAVGSQTGVYVNGVKLFTIEVTERPFTSDTTLDMSLKVGTPYMFRITPDDKNASFTFLTADGKALSTSYKAALYPDEKGDYYCTVTPLQANRDIGVYCVIGGNTYKVFTVHTIA